VAFDPAVLATSNVVFGVVFGLFVVVFVVLVVITLRWAVRRDRQGRIEWEPRHQATGGSAGPRPRGLRRLPPSTNGHAPEPRPADPESAP